MAINPKSPEDQDNLNERLRSLKIDRSPAPPPAVQNRLPKVLLLGISALVALAAVGYFYFFFSPKTITAAQGKLEGGGASDSDNTRLSSSGYRGAHHNNS